MRGESKRVRLLTSAATGNGRTGKKKNATAVLAVASDETGAFG